MPLPFQNQYDHFNNKKKCSQDGNSKQLFITLVSCNDQKMASQIKLGEEYSLELKLVFYSIPLFSTDTPSRTCGAAVSPRTLPSVAPCTTPCACGSDR